MSWYDYFGLIFIVGWAGVGIFRWYANSKGILDKPNDRSSHCEPTPRGGGIVFVIGTLILGGLLHYFNLIQYNQLIYFVPAILVGIVGFFDDLKPLSASTRLIIQFLCAGTVLFLLKEGGYLLMDYVDLPLPLCFLGLCFGMVWFTNLFNFMDGTDGLAATEGALCLTVGGYMIFQAKGGLDIATYLFGISSLVISFLSWNWPGAKIFMGDAGSGFLGFLISVVALISYKLFEVPIQVWLILTSLFWFDATVTLVRRLWHKEKWYLAHRKHAYQRLAQTAWGHKGVLYGSIMVNAILTCLTMWAYHKPQVTHIALGIAIALLSCLYILIEIVKPMYPKLQANILLEDID